MLPQTTKDQLNKIDFNLKDKVVIITGGTAGIGKATAEYLLGQGCKVVITGRRADADGVAKSLCDKGNCLGLSGDMMDSSFRKEILAKTIETFGTVDALVNSAGTNILELAKDVKEESWDTILDLNLKSAFFMAQAVGNYWIESKKPGSIVNISSQAGIVAIEKHTAYSASKAGMKAMGGVLAMEWGQYGIRINAVAPTIVLTELGKEAWGGAEGDVMKAKMPSGRFAEPEEIATAIAFLCSDASAMITGHELVVDGGYTIC